MNQLFRVSLQAGKDQCPNSAVMRVERPPLERGSALCSNQAFTGPGPAPLLGRTPLFGRSISSEITDTPRNTCDRRLGTPRSVKLTHEAKRGSGVPGTCLPRCRAPQE